MKMIKKLITMSIGVILIFGLAGCLSSEKVDDGKLRGGTTMLSTDCCKDHPTLNFDYVVDKKEFNIGDNVGIEFFYGTDTTRDEIYQSTHDLPNAEEAYKAAIYMISKEGYFTSEEKLDIGANPLDYPTTIVIKEFDEFYSENFPHPIEGVYSNSYKMTLSPELFKGEYGHIMIKMDMFGDSYGGEIYYKIENDKVTLSNERFPLSGTDA